MEEKFLASLFIKGLSGHKYGKLKDELSNQCSWGNNNYPEDITAAYEMALNYCNTDNNRRDRFRNNNNINRLSFSQNNNGGNNSSNQQAVARTDSCTWYNTVCYHCGQPRHQAALNPEANRGDNTSRSGDSSMATDEQAQRGVSHFM